MAENSNIKRVETEFVNCGEEVADEAEEILSEFFEKRKGTRYRAFTENDLRYLLVSNDGELEIIEEEGEWMEGSSEPDPDNDYELISKDEKGYIRYEDVDFEFVESVLMDF